MPSALLTASLGRCPRCSTGKLFSGVMAIAPHCAACQLSFKGQDSGDGPVFFALILVGFLSVGLAAFMELHYAPPYWLQAVVWIPFTILTCIGCMRFFKAWLIAIQFKHSPETFV